MQIFPKTEVWTLQHHGRCKQLYSQRMYQGLTANTSQDLTRLLGFQSITYKPLALPSFIMFLIQAKIAWQANSNHAGHAAHDPAWDSWRFWWGTHLEASEYMRQSTAFLYHSVTTSCGACPCSPEASLFALAPGHAERTAMSSWILVPGPFKTMKFD